MNKALKKIILKSITFYRNISKHKSLLLPQVFSTDNSKSLLGTCRFQPTCSQYMYLSIKKYGIFKGVLLGFKRIIKCHPWSAGGYDPLPE